MIKKQFMPLIHRGRSIQERYLYDTEEEAMEDIRDIAERVSWGREEKFDYATIEIRITLDEEDD